MNGVPRRVLRHSVRKHTRFNRRPPRKVVRVTLDTKTPLIRIGEVKTICYVSNKEGSLAEYEHTTKRPRPVMYGHPSGKYFIIVGGVVKVDDWLYD